MKSDPMGESVGGFYITAAPASGPDNPRDMAQAWLDGDFARYEALLAKHLKRRRPVIITPKRSSRPKGRPRKLDWSMIVELRRQGLTMAEIAERLGCAPSHVFRVLNK